MSTQSRTPSPTTATPSRGGNTPARSAATRAPASQRAGNSAAIAKKEPGGVGETLRGWWTGAADWVGDRYDDARDAVTDAYHTTQRVAGDVADVVRSTSVGYENGTLTASTDADEVMDLLPASMRGGVELDKKNPSANRVNLSLDTKSGRLTVAVPDLQMKAMSGSGVRAGPTQLRGVVVTMDGADKKAREVMQRAAGETVTGWVFGKEQPQKAPSRTQVKVAQATATDVQAGGTAARQIDLGGIDLTLEEGEKGGVGAFFSVDAAAVSGLRTAGAEAGEVSASGVSGSLGADRESGSLGAERLAARDLRTASGELSSGEVRDVRASFANRGGGLPVVDARPDRDLRVEGSAASARVDGARAAGTSLRSASTTNARVRTAPGATSVDLDALDVDGLDGASLDVARGHAERVRLATDVNGTTLGAGAVDAQGVDGGANAASRVRAENLAVTRRATQTAVSADRARVDAGRAGATRVAGADVSGLAVTTGADGLSAQARSADLSGVSSTTLDAATLNARNVALARSSDRTRVSADTAQGSRLRVGEARAAAADVSGLRADLDAASVDAGARSVDVRSLDTKTVDAARASATNLAVTRSPNGTRIAADGAAVRGLEAGATRVTAADAQELAVASGADGSVRGSVGAATVTGVDTPGVDVARAQVRNLTGSRSERGTAVRADEADVSGLEARGARVGSARATKLDAALEGGAGRVAVTGASARDVQAGGARVAGIDVTDASVRGSQAGGLRTEGSVGRVAVSGVDTRTVDARAAELQGASWSVSPERAQASVAGAAVQGVSAGANALGEARIGKVDASFDGASESGRVRVADVSARDVVTPAARVASASGQQIDVAATNRGGGLPMLDPRADDLRVDARARHVDASGIDGSRVDARSFTADQVSVDTRGNAPVVGVGTARASGVDVRHDGAGVHLDQATVVDGRARLGGGIDASADALRATGVRFDAAYGARHGGTSGGASRGGADREGLDFRSLASAVDEASVRASVPLVAADHGALEVRPGTRADVRAEVRNGAVDPSTTNLRLSRPVDGPLWTEVNGVYLDPDRSGRSAAVRADVSGWKDPNLTTSLPGKPETLPLDLPSLVQQVAPSPTAGGARAGASASGGGLGSVVDLSSASVTGSAHVRNGRVDLGSAEGTITGERSTDNRVNFEADGAGRIALMFSRLLMSNMRVDAGGQRIDAGGVASSDAKLEVRQGAGGQQAEGSIGAVELRDLQTRPSGR